MRKSRFSFLHYLLIIFIFFVYARPYQFLSFLEPLKLTRISMLFVLALSVFQKDKNLSILKEKGYKYLVILNILVIALIPFSLWPGGSFNDYTSGYLKLFITFHILVTLINSREKFNAILNTISFSMIIIALAMIKAYKNNQVIFSGMVKRVSGVETLASGDPNDVALALAMILPVIFYFFFTQKGLLNKIMNLFILSILSVAIVYTGSRGGYLSVTVATFIFFYNLYQKQKHKFVLISLLLISLTLIFMPPTFKQRFMSIFDKSDYNYSHKHKGSGRVAIWKRGIKTVLKSPQGTGINTYSISEGNRKKEMNMTGSWQVAHNSYLQIAVELGILGLLFYLLLLKSAFNNLSFIINYSQKIKDNNTKVLAIALKSSLTAFLVASFFLSQAFYWNHYIFIALIIGLKNSLKIEQTKSTSK